MWKGLNATGRWTKFAFRRGQATVGMDEKSSPICCRRLWRRLFRLPPAPQTWFSEFIIEGREDWCVTQVEMSFLGWNLVAYKCNLKYLWAIGLPRVDLDQVSTLIQPSLPLCELSLRGHCSCCLSVDLINLARHSPYLPQDEEEGWAGFWETCKKTLPSTRFMPRSRILRMSQRIEEKAQ